MLGIRLICIHAYVCVKLTAFVLTVHIILILTYVCACTRNLLKTYLKKSKFKITYCKYILCSDKYDASTDIRGVSTRQLWMYPIVQ